VSKGTAVRFQGLAERVKKLEGIITLTVIPQTRIIRKKLFRGATSNIGRILMLRTGSSRKRQLERLKMRTNFFSSL
jgi:hypothetical protein